MRSIVVATLLALAAASVAVDAFAFGSPDWVQGLYWGRGGPDTEQDLEPIAKQGNREAQFQLGTGLLYGRGRFRTDENEGLSWLRKAAEQREPAAALHLGAYLANEKGNIDEGIVWLRRAASAGAIPERRAFVMGAPDEIIAARLLGAQLLGTSSSAEGVDWLRKASEQGDRISRLLLGTAYIDGSGVPKDRAKGLEAILGARGRATLTAVSIAALVQAEGIGGPANTKEAAKVLGAGAGSDAEALFSIGRLYHQGFWYDREERPLVDWFLARTGVTKDSLADFYARQRDGGTYGWADPDRALEFYAKAAELGHIGAQVNLGVIYSNPDGGHWNCGEAMKWMKRAAERNDPTALFNMGWAYWKGPDRSSVRIGIQMEEATGGVRVTQVQDGLPAARAGLRAGDVLLALNGRPVPQLGGMRGVTKAIGESDKKKITLLVERGAQKLSLEALPETVVTPCPGAAAAGWKTDSAEAIRWFEKAGDAGHLSGLFFLASAYREGRGVARDPAKAIELYRRSAGRGDWEAAQALAHMYSAGDGVEKNQALADQWFRKAVELKHESLGRGSDYFLHR